MSQQLLHLIALRLKIINQTRWRYPHNSFTCKGPGLKHDEGRSGGAKLIHKSLTKQVRSDYTQNKAELAFEEVFK